MAAHVFGVIAPHPPILVSAVGGSRAHGAQDSLDALSAMESALSTFAPETIVVMSPHAPALADAIAVDDSAELEGSLSQFGDATQRRFEGDPILARELLSELAARTVRSIARSEDPRLRAGWLDHGVLVPMSFLDPLHMHRLVVISLSYLPYAQHRVIGEALRTVSERLGRRIAFVASGDLAHRLTPDAPAGYSPKAARLDEAIVGVVRHGHLADLSSIDEGLVEAGGECGLRSFIAMSGYAGDDPVPTRVLSYEGPWGVGYLCALVGAAALEAADGQALVTPEHASHATPDRGAKGGMPGEPESEIVTLARHAITAHITHGERLTDAALNSAEYPARAGAFVSLHLDGRLRGCIGTILPTKDTLAEEVTANAIEAATHDPRFAPVSAEELDNLDVKVDVLHAPEVCSIEDLDPKRYGVITSSGWRRGLLLPDLEGVDDARTQIEIAMNKAGIRPGEPCSYERFRVDRYT